MTSKNWNSSYNKEDNSELRRLQFIELEVMKLFSGICDKHHLRYYFSWWYYVGGC